MSGETSTVVVTLLTVSVSDKAFTSLAAKRISLVREHSQSQTQRAGIPGVVVAARNSGPLNEINYLRFAGAYRLKLTYRRPE